jgi:hypothetical protein
MVSEDENGCFEITDLGRATLKGTIDLVISNQLKSDLCEAVEVLNVNVTLQLLYLVTPYDLIEGNLCLDWRRVLNKV